MCAVRVPATVLLRCAITSFSCRLIRAKYIEITSWKARAYGILTRVGEVSEIERVRAANE